MWDIPRGFDFGDFEHIRIDLESIQAYLESIEAGLTPIQLDDAALGEIDLESFLADIGLAETDKGDDGLGDER